MCKQIISPRIRTVLPRCLQRDILKRPVYIEFNLHIRPTHVKIDYITENSYSAAAFFTKRLQKRPIYIECDLHIRPTHVKKDHITENSSSAAALSTKRHTKETYLHRMQSTHQTYSCENRLYHREFVQCCRIFYTETYKKDLCTLNLTYT